MTFFRIPCIWNVVYWGLKLGCWVSGVCLVQRFIGGARGNILVPVCRRYGSSACRTAARHLGCLSTFPNPERLSADGWWGMMGSDWQWQFTMHFIHFSAIDNLKNGRFHQHLQDTFAPLVVRYVDLMESSIAQSIHKGFEKERWELKG